jgi:hypothetical protein
MMNIYDVESAHTQPRGGKLIIKNAFVMPSIKSRFHDLPVL